MLRVEHCRVEQATRLSAGQPAQQSLSRSGSPLPAVVTTPITEEKVTIADRGPLAL